MSELKTLTKRIIGLQTHYNEVKGELDETSEELKNNKGKLAQAMKDGDLKTNTPYEIEGHVVEYSKDGEGYPTLKKCEPLIKL